MEGGEVSYHTSSTYSVKKNTLYQPFLFCREKAAKKAKPAKTKAAKFYDSDDEKDNVNGGGDEESEDSSPDSSSSDSSSSESSSESEKEVAVTVAPKTGEAKKKITSKPPPSKSSHPAPKPKTKAKVDPDTSSSSSSDSDSDDHDRKSRAPRNSSKPPPPPVSNLSLLLDLEEMPPTMPTPTLTPSLGGLLSPTPSSASNVATSLGQPMFVPTEKRELVNKLVTGGVQVDARFTRHAHIYSATMVSIELTFENLGSDEVGEIKLGARSLAPGMTVHEFPALLGLQPNERRNVSLGVDFNDTTQAARVDLVIGGRAHTVNLACPTGEMLRPLVMPAITFADEQVFPTHEIYCLPVCSNFQAKLRGMNESGGGVKLPSTACDTKSIIDRIYRAANMLQVY